MVLLAELIARDEDSFGYITYVFRNLEKDATLKTRYIMCVRYPNWEHKNLELGDIGYLHFKEIRAGLDKWYDGENFIPYKYDDIQFIKFVYKPEDVEYKYII